MRIKFINAAIGACKGTAIFFELMRQSLGRAFWHLFLMTVVCAMFIAGVRSFSIYPEIDRGCREAEQQCGKINFTERGIYPEKQPGQVKLFSVGDDMSICYIPKKHQGKLPPFDREEARQGIIWTPGIMLFWSKVDKQEYWLFPLLYYKLKSGIRTRTYSKSGIAAYLQENSAPGGTLNYPMESMLPTGYASPLKFNATIIIFILYCAQIMLLGMLFIAVFALIFSLVGGRRIKALKLRDLFVIGIYASFPAMIVGSFFPAFQLPFLDYQTVYLFGFTGYLMVVINRIERQKMSASEETDSEGLG